MPKKNKPQLDHSDDPTYKGARKKRSEALQIFWIIFAIVVIAAFILAIVCFAFGMSLVGWITVGVALACLVGDSIYIIVIYVSTREAVKQEYYASSLRIEKYIEENKAKEEENKNKSTLPKA